MFDPGGMLAPTASTLPWFFWVNASGSTGWVANAALATSATVRPKRKRVFLSMEPLSFRGEGRKHPATRGMVGDPTLRIKRAHITLARQLCPVHPHQKNSNFRRFF